jgi:hypothetical protein
MQKHSRINKKYNKVLLSKGKEVLINQNRLLGIVKLKLNKVNKPSLTKYSKVSHFRNRIYLNQD